jgi:hypothetical protein
MNCDWSVIGLPRCEKVFDKGSDDETTHMKEMPGAITLKIITETTL